MTFYLATGALGFVVLILAVAYREMHRSRQLWRRRAAAYLTQALFWEDAWLRDVRALLESWERKEPQRAQRTRSQRSKS